MEINPSWCQKQTFSCIYDSQHSAPVEARGQHATETPSSHPPAQRTAGCVWRSSGTKPRFSTWIQLHRFGVRRGVIKSYKALHNVAEKAAHFCLAYVTFSLGSHWLSDSGFTFLLRLTLSFGVWSFHMIQARLIRFFPDCQEQKTGSGGVTSVFFSQRRRM